MVSVSLVPGLEVIKHMGNNGLECELDNGGG